MRTSDMRMFEAGRCRTADREGVDGRWTRGGGGGRGGKTQKGDDGKVGEHHTGWLGEIRQSSAGGFN